MFNAGGGPAIQFSSPFVPLPSPGVPSNYFVDLFNNQSNIAGDKGWTGDQTITKATPTLGLVASTTTIATLLASSATDTGTNPILAVNTRIGTNTAGATRPLVGLLNNGTTMLTFVPLNSGAQGALNFGTSAGNVPTTALRSVGTRLILRDTFSPGSAADVAIGVESGPFKWESVPGALSSGGWKRYGGSTLIDTLRGDGAYGLGTSPVTGVQMNLGGPLGHKSYTVATLPVATTQAGMEVYVSDAAVAPCLAFSNGTNWKRCDNAATTVV